MWAEIIPYILQVVVILGTAGIIGSVKGVRKLFDLPKEFETFQVQNAHDHQNVQANLRLVSRSQEKLSLDLIDLKTKQLENHVDIAKHEIRLSQLET